MHLTVLLAQWPADSSEAAGHAAKPRALACAKSCARLEVADGRSRCALAASHLSVIALGGVPRLRLRACSLRARLRDSKTIDARVRYRVTEQVTASLSMDNLNNDRYWNFHPYPQRTLAAELDIAF